MDDRSLSRHAITFFALKAILTQVATLAISDFGSTSVCRFPSSPSTDKEAGSVVKVRIN
jgi:hypothetical protein